MSDDHCLESLYFIPGKGITFLSMAPLISFRALYPNLQYLVLENVMKSNFTFDNYSSLLFLPFRHLRSLQVINCFFSFSDQDASVNTWSRDLAQEFTELREFRWDGLPFKDEHLEKLLRGLKQLKRLTLICLQGYKNFSGPLTN